MVNLTRFLFARAKKNAVRQKPDGYWRKRQVLLLTQHFYGRGRNCFSIAIRHLQKALQYVAQGRKLRKIHMKEMWADRVDAGCVELGYLPEGSRTMYEGLSRSNVLLNGQTLSTLAVWEPRTFEALNKIAAAKAREQKIARYLGPFPRGILGKL